MIEELYAKYHTELTRFCASMCEDRDTAEELVQEAWLRALSHEKDLGALEEAQRRAWMYRTVKHLFIDRYRRLKHETVLEETTVPDMPLDLSMLEWALLLKALPSNEGQIFSLRYLQGYNASQIGEMLDMPPGSVRSKLHDARKHLREMLSGG